MISAKFLLTGSQEDGKKIEKEASQKFYENVLHYAERYQKIMLKMKEEEKKEDKEIWFDFRKAPDATEEQIELFISLMEIYSHEPEIVAGQYRETYEQFNTLKGLLEKLDIFDRMNISEVEESLS